MPIPSWDPLDPRVLALKRDCTLAWGHVRYGWTLPVNSPYGDRINPVTHVEQFHAGLDIPVRYGTQVLSVLAGEVHRIDVAGVGKGEINGNAITIATGAFQFAYLHLSAVFVQFGEQVAKGRVIGLVGATGRATGPHLHFQVYWYGRTIDPRILYPSGLFRGGTK